MNTSEQYLPNLEDFVNITNMTESEYLKSILGAKRPPLYLVLPITLVYVVIFVTGVFGNIVTCIVIKRNPEMQTATNYYLFNLAISDLLLLVLGLPNELSIFWQQYPWKLGLAMCKIRAYVSEMSSYVSVLTIVAFSWERYLAICYPLQFYGMSGPKRPIRVIITAWLIAYFFAIPFAVYTTINYVEYPPKSGNNSEESAFCAMLVRNMPNFPLYELSCFIFFLVPMLFIAVLYIRMGLKIQSSTLDHSIESSVHGETTQAQSRKTIIPMLSAIVITFFICWAPFHAQRLLYVYDVSKSKDINEWLYPLGGCLYYFSTTLNPILYNLMSAKYRVAFKQTLCCSPNASAFTKDSVSSMRDVSVCSYGSRRESPLARASMKCNKDRLGRHTSARLRSDDEKKKHCATGVGNISSRNKNTREGKPLAEPLLQKSKKHRSFVVQNSNAGVKCQTFKKESGNPSTETHI